jgi:hypothetical protein
MDGSLGRHAAVKFVRQRRQDRAPRAVEGVTAREARSTAPIGDDGRLRSESLSLVVPKLNQFVGRG